MGKQVSNEHTVVQKAMRFVRMHLLTFLSGVGLVGGIVYSLTLGTPTSAPPQQLSTPPTSPFDQNISGLGIVEANSENIRLGSFSSGIVKEVFVKAGETVEKGQPLFALDQKKASAEVALRQQEILVAQAEQAIAQVNLEEKKQELKRGLLLSVGQEITQAERQKRQFAVRRAETELDRRKQVYEQAKTQHQLAHVVLDQLTVYAPISGTILEVNVHPGESINTLAQIAENIILMGHTHPLHLRVQIDENDVWRFNAKAKAYAYLKSNKEIHFSLAFIRAEPHVHPKRELSGESTEKIDTRVMDIIYRIEGHTDDLRIGQKFDVFIEGKTPYALSRNGGQKSSVQ